MLWFSQFVSFFKKIEAAYLLLSPSIKVTPCTKFSVSLFLLQLLVKHLGLPFFESPINT